MRTFVTRRLPAALFLLLFLLGSVALRARPVSAHAELAQSDPPAQSSLSRAPAQAQLLFSEAVDPGSVEVSVLDRDRKRVDRGDGRLQGPGNDTVVLSLGDLPPGVYTISWKVTSAVDGHTTRGLVPFAVGDPGAVPEPLSAAEIGTATSGGSAVQEGPAGVIARWLTLLSMLALGGLFVAGPLLMRPVVARLDAMRDGRDEAAVTHEAPEQVASAVLGRVRRLAWIALGLFFIGSILLLGVDAAAAAGSSLWRGLTSDLFEPFGSRTGVLWLIRCGLALLIAATLLASRRRPTDEDRQRLWWGLAVATGGMLLLTSLGSHSAAERSATALAVAVDWIHLAAGAVWIGGLIFIGLALLPSLGPLGGPARTRLLSDLVPRFSTIAAASVGVLILTGVFQTWRLLERLGAITELDWGRALLVKLAVFVALLALAAVNLLYIRPRLGRLSRSMDRASREQAASLRVTFRRVVLGEAALGVLVVLVVGVLTGVTPAETTLALPDGPFRPFVLDARAEDLSGRLILSPGRIGNNRFDLTVSAGEGGQLPAGTTAVLRITTLDRDTGVAEARMETLAPGRFTTAGSYLSTTGLWEVAAHIRRDGQPDVILPFRLSLGEATGRPVTREQRPAAPLARGRQIYQQNCVACHGSGGRGDGPLAAGLQPPPVDLTVHVPQHDDETIAGWISNGIPRTSMPAWGGQFSQEEMQAVVNYLRDLAKQSGQDR